MSRNILFKDDAFQSPNTMVSEHSEFEGASMKTKLVALIDGKLSKTTITSTDGSPIKISALAVLTDCIINCNDLLIEGSFTGQIIATGNVELGESALVQGEASIYGTFVCSPLADCVDMRLSHPSPQRVASAMDSKPAVAPGIYDLKLHSTSSSEVARLVA